MNLRVLAVMFLVAVAGWAQAPAGRWEGMVVFGTLKLPFTFYFEGSGTSVTGSFVNGETRASSTSGSFEGGMLRLSFERYGTRLEATLADGELKGAYGGAKNGMHPFTASAYCTCAYEGEAGPQIMGAWEIPEAGWRLAIRRKGDDTLATVSRPAGDLGPLTGRFDGVTFTLRYFDGVRAAMLEIEPRKDDGLDLVWKAPGEDVKKYKAMRRRAQH